MSDKIMVHANHRKRLRDRYKREGITNFEHHEMLELLLFSVIPRANTNPTAHNLLNRFGTLHGVFDASYEELIKVQGIGDKTARFIVDISKEFYAQCEREIMSSPCRSFEAASNLLIWHNRRLVREGMDNFGASIIYLNREFEIIMLSDEKKLDLDSINKIAAECGASRIVIGISSETIMKSLTPIKSDAVKICDIIFVNGVETVSVAEKYLNG